MSGEGRGKFMPLLALKKSNVHNSDTIRLIYFICCLILIVAVFSYIGYLHEPLTLLKGYLKNAVDPLFFMLLLLVLPILGVPVSVFLVPAGMKFGMAGGLILAAFSMAFHMTVSYAMAHLFLQDWALRLLKRFRLSFPDFKNGRKYRHAFIFMLVPGLPYAMKNYVLALTEIGFGRYMLINWTAQFSTSIPLIVMGKGIIEMNPVILAYALGLLSVCYLLYYFLRRQQKKFSEKNSR